METDMISAPIPVGKKTAPNRIVFQPMECNDADPSGDPSDLSINRYRRFAEGGAGVIFSESLTLTTESRARKSQMAITEPNAEGLARLIKEMRDVNQDSLILFQLNQSGKLSEAAFSKVISVYPTGDPDMHVLTAEEIGRRWLKGLAVALIAIMVMVYSLLSYYPPRNFLFEHPETGEYGILQSYEGHDHEEDHVD